MNVWRAIPHALCDATLVARKFSTTTATGCSQSDHAPPACGASRGEDEAPIMCALTSTSAPHCRSKHLRKRGAQPRKQTSKHPSTPYRQKIETLLRRGSQAVFNSANMEGFHPPKGPTDAECAGGVTDWAGAFLEDMWPQEVVKAGKGV